MQATSPSPARAALFDMDRTLVRRNTAALYTRYQRDLGAATWADMVRVGLWLFSHYVGLMNPERVAERVLRGFRGQVDSELLASCQRWFRDYVLPEVVAEGRRAVEYHRENGEVLVLVTAASQYAARPLAEELGIPHVLCTELEVQAGVLTGRVQGDVCYGEKKIARAESLGQALGFDLKQATFYSDSITDRPLLEVVQRPVAINPDARLRRLAERRSWEIARWG